MRYNPKNRNTHVVRVTFNSDGYEGHIAMRVGGNTRGGDILKYALDFIENCDDNDIENLVENDCTFELCSDEDDEEFWFNMTLTRENGVVSDKLVISEAEDSEVKDMIVSVAIVDCQPE